MLFLVVVLMVSVMVLMMVLLVRRIIFCFMPMGLTSGTAIAKLLLIYIMTSHIMLSHMGEQMGCA